MKKEMTGAVDGSAGNERISESGGMIGAVLPSSYCIMPLTWMQRMARLPERHQTLPPLRNTENFLRRQWYQRQKLEYWEGEKK